MSIQEQLTKIREDLAAISMILVSHQIMAMDLSLEEIPAKASELYSDYRQRAAAALKAGVEEG